MHAQSDLSSVEVAEAMFQAFSDGHLDEMFSYIHPEIRWMPLTRPGRSVYVGHAETELMLLDVKRQLGDYRLEWKEFAEREDGTVVCVGRAVAILDGLESTVVAFECVLTLRDGLVSQLESYPHPGP